MGGGGYSDAFINTIHRLGGFQKNEYFWGYDENVDIFFWGGGGGVGGGHHKTGIFLGGHLYSFRAFS